jgi:hypothetical protein
VVGTSGKAVAMSADTDAVEAAARDLVHAMSQLIRAIDATGDDGTAVGAISEALPASLEELAHRLNAARGFGG